MPKEVDALRKLADAIHLEAAATAVAHHHGQRLHLRACGTNIPSGWEEGEAALVAEMMKVINANTGELVDQALNVLRAKVFNLREAAAQASAEDQGLRASGASEVRDDG